MYARFLASSSLSLATASGVALMSLPLPVSVPTAIALAVGAAAVLAWRDRDIAAYYLPKPALRSTLVIVPSGERRELTRDLDPAFAPISNDDKPRPLLPASDFRKAEPSDHAFRRGDRVEFVFDSWEQGEVVMRGEIEHTYSTLGYRVGCDNGEPYYVPRDCLIFVGEAAR